MKTYTFTETELKDILRAVLERYTDQDNVFDSSYGNTGKEVAVEETMMYLEPDNDRQAESISEEAM